MASSDGNTLVVTILLRRIWPAADIQEIWARMTGIEAGLGSQSTNKALLYIGVNVNRKILVKIILVGALLGVASALAIAMTGLSPSVAIPIAAGTTGVVSAVLLGRQQSGS